MANGRLRQAPESIGNPWRGCPRWGASGLDPGNVLVGVDDHHHFPWRCELSAFRSLPSSYSLAQT
jgi:hypothetical protein